MINLDYYNFNIINRDQYYLFRYFPSFDRLKSFLTDGIYLGRADKYSDNLECVTKNIMVEINRINGFQELESEHNPHLTPVELNNEKVKFRRKMKELADELILNQKKYFISSWYIEQSPIENELMWRSYGSNKGDKGYLLRVNLKDFLGHLESSISQPENKHLPKLVVGQVKYFDFTNNENIKEVKYAGFRKHFSFKGESEFRLLIKTENTSETSESMYIKLRNSFYDDTLIFCHPNTDHDEYIKLKNEIRPLGIDLSVSKMNIWYKLRAFSKTT